MYEGEFFGYFTEFNAADSDIIQRFMRNAFIVEASYLPNYTQEEVIELQNDSTCKNACSQTSLLIMSLGVTYNKK